MHPGGERRSIELALFPEHRFAFYYWVKWTNELKGVIPSLVTFDWHQDLCGPYEDQVEEMKALDVENKVDVALYTWGKLSHNNDVQIHAALKHNKIKNVYAICRQNVDREKEQKITDFYGNEHQVFIFKSIEDFENHLSEIEESSIYFDIDLDYFTLSNPLSLKCPYKLRDFTYMTRKQIVNLLSPNNPTIEWIFSRMEGFTIATEPEFCGGLKKSNYFLQIIDNLYFTPSLFYKVPGSATKYTRWKHLCT
jgi:hypothetical protein